jgi:hypothetical protein
LLEGKTGESVGEIGSWTENSLVRCDVKNRKNLSDFASDGMDFALFYLENKILLKIQACFMIDSIVRVGSFVSYETYRFRVGTAAGLGVWD